MTIRKIIPTDIRSVAELLHEELSKPPYNEKAPLSAAIKSVKFFLKIGNGFVAIEKRNIVGVIYFKIEIWWSGPAMEIEDLVVKKEFQGKGIGKALLQKAEAFAKKKKVTRVVLNTNRHSAARKFYEKAGYEWLKNTVAYRKKL